jgi:hypothetical protein
MEIAADAAGIGIRASGFRLENQIPLFPPLTKGEERGIFFCLLTYGGTAGYEIAASLSLLAMTGNHLFTGHR